MQSSRSKKQQAAFKQLLLCNKKWKIFNETLKITLDIAPIGYRSFKHPHKYLKWSEWILYQE